MIRIIAQLVLIIIWIFRRGFVHANKLLPKFQINAIHVVALVSIVSKIKTIAQVVLIAI